VKFVIAGLGSAGQRHLRNLQRLQPSAEYIAWRVRGRNLLIDDRVQATAGTPETAYSLRVVGRLEDALAERPDGIIVANPISMHCETALAAVHAGCAVFIEKPLAHRWDGVPALLDDRARSGVPVMVGYQMRFHPVVRRVKEHLDAGRVGRPVSALLHFGEYLPDMHAYEDYRDSHASRADQGGGAILCLSHEVDIAHYLFGEPSSVYAAGGHLSELDMDVEDTALLSLEHSWEGRRLPVSVSLDFVQRPPQRYGEVVGDGGTLRWDLREPLVSLYDVATGAWEHERFPEFNRNQLFIEEMAAFLRAIETRATPELSAESGARTLLTALAAKKSLASGQPVPVGALTPGEGSRG
jgi:predicted dehydrogenase